MKSQIYAIKDVVPGEFMAPFNMRNDAEVMRAFENSIKEGKSENPQDLELYKLGEFDGTTGEITSKIEFLMNGSAVLNKIKSQSVRKKTAGENK